MAVSEEKTRVLITITKSQKEKLDKIKEKEKRSLSNLCAKIISDYLDSLKYKDGE